MPSHSLSAFLQQNLNDLQQQGLYNTIQPLESPNGPLITIQGREYVNLSSIIIWV
ncbi:2-amino-3-ketobutyrate coenzyme A ligase [Paenibacillus sp. JCM 10914]|nr:2-amino-3-ketobutyrate coenzyme A ligase [Paenibacillus sp. JCM 10914]